MLNLKGPGVLIRISHLILIQIFFIFSALALILFYPVKDDGLNQEWGRIERLALTDAAKVTNILDGHSRPVAPDARTLSHIKDIITMERPLAGFELIYFDSTENADGRILMRSLEDNYITYPDSSCQGCRHIYNYLRYSHRPFLPQMSVSSETVRYFMIPTEADLNYLYSFAFDVPRQNPLEGRQSQILMLLFLVSTLISLLIINLISRGVKSPLKALVRAFEETAAGREQVLAEEEGDDDIKQLATAFNTMSLSLTSEKRKLADANTQLIKANQSLVESESILTSLVDYSPDAIIVTDMDDQIIIYNQTAARDFAYNQSNMLGRKISNLFSFSKAKNPSTEEADDTLDFKEVICRRRDGSKFPALLVNTPLGPEGSKPIAMLYFFKNISESRNYQEMVLKLDRVASRGKMARDIAHEINNYLAVLQGNLELLPMVIAKGDTQKTEERISLLRQSVNNIANFTEGLSRFSEENSEFRKEDLNQLIENLLAFLKPQNKFDNIFIGTNLSEYLPMVSLDPAQVQLAVSNILNNSAEALVGTEGKKWIVISTALDETGEHCYIKIANSGPAIPEELVEKLFVRRFSTRRDGNGLGLINCKNVIDNHGGEISYHSTEESHAIFVIKLPVTRPGENAAPVANQEIVHSTPSPVIK